jgi:transcriptional regulator GlxA family with amidase domain
MITLSTEPSTQTAPNYSQRAAGSTAQLEMAWHRASECLRNEITQLPAPDLKANRRIESSLRYMMDHLNEPMRISMLSAKVGLSESCFFAHFKNATGHTPVRLLIRARMRWAGELLEATDLQIKEIAGLVGYDDQFYFSRLFKSVHGLSPRNYRLQKAPVLEGN